MGCAVCMSNTFSYSNLRNFCHMVPLFFSQKGREKRTQTKNPTPTHLIQCVPTLLVPIDTSQFSADHTELKHICPKISQPLLKNGLQLQQIQEVQFTFSFQPLHHPFLHFHLHHTSTFPPPHLHHQLHMHHPYYKSLVR